MIISTVKSEITRITQGIPTGCVFKAVDELQKYVQTYTFETPLTNLHPVGKVKITSNKTGVTIYEGILKIEVLTKANVNDDEDTKDTYIDICINAMGQIHKELRRNSERKFINPTFEMNCDIDRFKTSNYCVGVIATVNFSTGCNRV